MISPAISGRAPLTCPPRHTHWIAFDPSRRNAARITATLAAGSGFRAERVYLHPTRGDLYLLEVSAPVPYQDLDLDLNSLSSPLRRLSRRPMGLGPGIALEIFEKIFGPIIPREVWATRPPFHPPGSETTSL